MKPEKLPVQRPRRQRTAHKISKYDSSLGTKWSLKEKKRLLQALRVHDPDDLQAIRSNYLPKRSEAEIGWFLQRLKQPGKDRLPAANSVPIELWLQMCEDLTKHDPDYSFVLADVFSKMAELETHDPKQIPLDPDWCMIYNYLVALLRGDEPPDMGQIEAGVVLELIESLAQHLKSLDTTDQCAVMQHKHELLASLGNIQEGVAHARACSLLQQDTWEPHPTSTGPIPSTSSQQPDTSASQPLGSAGCQPSVSQCNDGGGDASNTQMPPGSSAQRPGEVAAGSTSKQPLFSINPFCIAIKHLNPRLKHVVTVPTVDTSTSASTT